MTPQIYEIFELVSKAPANERAKLLQKHNTNTLKMVLTHSFNENIKYCLPDGTPPYKPNVFPAGYADQTLYSECRRISYLWLTPPAGATKHKLETLFIELLENLHKDDAVILLAMKDKTLTKLYPAITRELVCEAFPSLLEPLPTKAPSTTSEPDNGEQVPSGNLLLGLETTDSTPPAKKPKKTKTDTKKKKVASPKKTNGEPKELQ